MKNLYRFKTAKGKTGHFAEKRFGIHEAPTEGMRATDRSTCVTEENVTTVDVLVGLQSQDIQKQHIIQYVRCPQRRV